LHRVGSITSVPNKMFGGKNRYIDSGLCTAKFSACLFSVLLAAASDAQDEYETIASSGTVLPSYSDVTGLVIWQGNYMSWNYDHRWSAFSGLAGDFLVPSQNSR
jgi:hypothetical protein